MISIFKRSFLIICVSLAALAVLIPACSRAEEPDTAFVKNVSIRYRQENAVYLNVDRHVIIEYVDGELVAHTDETLQKLFLTDLSTNVYSHEALSYTFMNDLQGSPYAEAWVPAQHGYKRIRCTNFGSYTPVSEGIFYDDNKGIAVLYSGLKKGAITETKFTTGCTDICLMPKLMFYEGNLPIANCTIEITAPRFVEMGFLLKNIDYKKVKHTTEEKGNTITHKYTWKNVPYLKDESNVPSYLYYMPHIIPYIKSYELPDDHREHLLLANAAGLYKDLYKFVRNINVAPDKEISRVVNKIIREDVTPRQKAVHIYNWVQKNVHYVAFEDSLGGFYPREAGKIIDRKYGDCKDMASLLVAMFRKAGIDAYFTWVGTRHMPYAISEAALPSNFNHMICAVKLGEDWIFVDGTHPTIPFGKVPVGDQGAEVMISIDKDHYKVVKIPEAAPNENTVNDTTYLNVISDKSVEGHMVAHFAGNQAYWLSAAMQHNKGEERERFLRLLTARGSNKYVLDKFHVEFEPNGNRDATITANFDIHDYLYKVKNNLIINMNVDKAFVNDWIDTRDRKADFYFENKQKITETVILELPSGVQVVHLPAAAQGSLKNVLGYKLSYKTSGRKVILTKEYELKSKSVDKKQFAAFNHLIDNLVKQYKESVVLSAS